jgi:hypothetical protein
MGLLKATNLFDGDADGIVSPDAGKNKNGHPDMKFRHVLIAAAPCLRDALVVADAVFDVTEVISRSNAIRRATFRRFPDDRVHVQAL